MKRAVLTIAAILIILLVVAFLPVKPHLIAPAWDVTVVDSQGAPVSGMKVDEKWHDYTCWPGQPCQRVTHEEHLVTDADGHARFPAIHTHRVPTRCLGGASQQVDQMMSDAHGNTKAYAVFGGESVAFIVEDRGYCIDWSGPTEGRTTKVVIPDKSLYGMPGPAR